MTKDQGTDPLSQRVAAEELNVGSTYAGCEHLAEASWLPFKEFDRRDGSVAVSVTHQSPY